MIEASAESGRGARILVVDDEPANLIIIDRVLKREGYEYVRTTAEGRHVAGIVQDFEPDLIVLDLHMPEPDGFAILKALSPRIDGPPVLVLTGDDSREAKRVALSLGARDFLAKPFDNTEMILRIRNLLETRFLHREVAEHNAQLESRVLERTRELESSRIEILERLARVAEIRDDETGRHTQRVGEIAAGIAMELDHDAHTVELIRRAAPLHDLGKIGIPDSILLKPDNLSPEERAVMQTHTIIGAKLLSGGRSELMKTAEIIALSHHERWDGQGYPHGISHESIPIEARIVAVADYIDALTHNRPYRSARPLDEVVEDVRSASGSHFDPAVVSALMSGRILATITPSPARARPAVRESERRLSASR